MAVRYFPEARKDITNVLKWTVEEFGEGASHRYKALISTAITEIEANPYLDFSYDLQGLQANVRLYHLKHSRDRAAVKGRTVKQPRHFVAYQVDGDDTVIVRVLHERMQLVQQLKDTL